MERGNGILNNVHDMFTSINYECQDNKVNDSDKNVLPTDSKGEEPDRKRNTNHPLISKLMDMGFTKEESARALENTKSGDSDNEHVHASVMWLMNHQKERAQMLFAAQTREAKAEKDGRMAYRVFHHPNVKPSTIAVEAKSKKHKLVPAGCTVVVARVLLEERRRRRKERKAAELEEAGVSIVVAKILLAERKRRRKEYQDWENTHKTAKSSAISTNMYTTYKTILLHVAIRSNTRTNCHIAPAWYQLHCSP